MTTSLRAWRLTLYRGLVGVLLALHCCKLKGELPGVIGRDGLYWSASSAQASLWAHWRELDTASLRVLLACSVLLALGIALGTFPRACAALLLAITVRLNRAGFPSSSLDDYLACVALFWVCVLPRGVPLWRIADELRRRAVVEGWTTSLLSLHLLIIQFDVSLWSTSALGWQPTRPVALAFCAVAAALVLPIATVRLVAVLGLATLHVWLLKKTGLSFAHGLFLASAALFWRERTDDAVPTRYGTGAVIGSLVVALSLVYRLADHFDAPLLAANAAHVLNDAGLLPLTSGARVPNERASVVFLSSRSGSSPVHVSAPDLAPGQRAQLMLEYLRSTAREHHDLRASIVSALVRRHCGTRSPRDFGTLALDTGGTLRDLAWYDCADPEAPPRVGMSDSTSLQ